MPDRSGDGGPTIRRAGRDQLLRVPSGLARYHATHHAVRLTTYDVAGGGATGSTATGVVVGVAHHLLAADSLDDGGTDVIWRLRYVDDYLHAEDGWRIVRRVLHLRGMIEERTVSHLGPGRRRPAGELPSD